MVKELVLSDEEEYYADLRYDFKVWKKIKIESPVAASDILICMVRQSCKFFLKKYRSVDCPASLLPFLAPRLGPHAQQPSRQFFINTFTHSSQIHQECLKSSHTLDLISHLISKLEMNSSFSGFSRMSRMPSTKYHSYPEYLTKR